jgi:Tol biopolymer transport system component
MQFYVMNADGSGKTDLIDAKDVLGIWRPEWSPTGNQILYTVIEKDYSSASLYIMNKDGTGSRKLNINESNAQSIGVWANK